MKNLFSLDGKVAFVTGASSGLGRHFALTLARAGATVIIGARRAEKLAEVAKEVETLGRHALPVFLDVTESDSIYHALDKTISSGIKKIDILINNAGNVVRKPTLEQTEEDWDSILDTQLKGTWLMSQAVAKHMISNHIHGSIINISSVMASRARKNIPAYAAAKAGISHLTRALALDLVEFHIRVNAIAPGWFETDLNRDFLTTEIGKEIVSRIPQKRTGDLEELDGPLLLLASGASSYMTGSILAVDGGCTTNAV